MPNTLKITEPKSPVEPEMVTMSTAELLALVKEAAGPNRRKMANQTREHPPAPDGWSGPFVGYYLWMNANNKRVLFDSFEDAVVAAEKKEDCRGITRTTTGKYSLRAMKGGEPIGNGPDKVEVSWVIGEMSVSKWKITPPPKPVEPEPEPEPEPVADPEPEPESDDESIDEDVSVEKWTSEGVDYLLDETSGKVYDYSSFQNDGDAVEIGYRVPNTDDGKLQPWDHDL